MVIFSRTHPYMHTYAHYSGMMIDCDFAALSILLGKIVSVGLLKKKVKNPVLISATRFSFMIHFYNFRSTK